MGLALGLGGQLREITPVLYPADRNQGSQVSPSACQLLLSPGPIKAIVQRLDNALAYS